MEAEDCWNTTEAAGLELISMIVRGYCKRGCSHGEIGNGPNKLQRTCPKKETIQTPIVMDLQDNWEQDLRELPPKSFWKAPNAQMGRCQNRLHFWLPKTGHPLSLGPPGPWRNVADTCDCTEASAQRIDPKATAGLPDSGHRTDRSTRKSDNRFLVES